MPEPHEPRTTSSDDDGVTELVVAPLGQSDDAAELALAVLAAALRQLGMVQGLGPLRTAVLAFERAPVALVVEPDGTTRAALGRRDQVPGSLLALLRRNADRAHEPTP